LALYLTCGLCGRKQAEGLLSRRRWSHLEDTPYGPLRACPLCQSRHPDWRSALLAVAAGVVGRAVERRLIRIGHKGAASLAPENTISSIAAAIEHDVDMVEFDVVDAPDGRLVLAHSREEIEHDAVTLDEALEYLASHSSRVELDLDLKMHGFETRIAAALRRYDLVERTLACSFFASSLRELRRCEPELRLGISYPWDKRGLSSKRVLSPVIPIGAAALRAALPRRIQRMAQMAEAGSVMLHYSVLSRATVERCHEAGLSVFAWTVDHEKLLQEVIATGVDGVITNDPRIFHAGAESG
jgi:glycerophosphoryl diester phosphodiesterase